jgi:reactive intermediate/imine deaminase
MATPDTTVSGKQCDFPEILGAYDAVNLDGGGSTTMWVRGSGVVNKPADGKQMITPLITHNGVIYIAGQGANSNGPVGKDDIDSHVTKVMENVKQLVEVGGGSMDSIMQLTVFLTTLDNFEAMNKIFKTYFPNGGPARTTVAVAGLPGNSLVEINCIAAITRK